MRLSGPAVICAFLVVSCAELGTAPSTIPQELTSTSPTTSHIDADAEPTDAEAPTELASLSVEADAGWRYGNAYAGGIVRYTATHVAGRVTVSSDSGSLSLEKSESHLSPAYRELQLPEPTVPMKECQGTITGHAFGRVWNEALVQKSVVKWGENSDSGAKHYTCPIPMTNQTTWSTGGSTTQKCYTLEIDHYWYYPATGKVEYRYTETRTWCESTADI